MIDAMYQVVMFLALAIGIILGAGILLALVALFFFGSMALISWLFDSR